jgi:hypothetical protein
MLQDTNVGEGTILQELLLPRLREAINPVCMLVENIDKWLGNTRIYLIYIQP